MIAINCRGEANCWLEPDYIVTRMRRKARGSESGARLLPRRLAARSDSLRRQSAHDTVVHAATRPPQLGAMSTWMVLYPRAATRGRTFSVNSEYDATFGSTELMPTWAS